MIFFDVTKTGAGKHRSGLTRVSERLRVELGARAQEVSWDSTASGFISKTAASPGRDDWFFTTELFSEDERPGIGAFLAASPGRTAALFHDAIPLKHPHITWPQSVARHPGYMKLLAHFNHVWAVSHASRDELLGFWRWQGIEHPPPVDVLPLGADFNSKPRVQRRAPIATRVPELLSLGIVEPRKNQSFLLDVCADLWAESVAFQLHVVGRVNPYFGKPIARRIKELQRKHPAYLQFHEAASDAKVDSLYATARATVFPTMAEGCGLPLLESLWMGVPCICSDLPVLRENADDGGCVTAPPNDHAAWKAAVRRIVTDDTLHSKLTAEAMSRTLPSWADAAQTLAQTLR